MTSKGRETTTETVGNGDNTRCEALHPEPADRVKVTPADVVYRVAAMTAALSLLATVL